jgi:hypothetical protein
MDDKLILEASGTNIRKANKLLKKGADIEARDEKGMTPLHIALMVGHTEMVKFLLEKGADVNARDDNGWTPLHWAVSGLGVAVGDQFGKTNLKLLLGYGANVNTRNNDGVTPFQNAVNLDRMDFATILRQSGGVE